MPCQATVSRSTCGGSDGSTLRNMLLLPAWSPRLRSHVPETRGAQRARTISAELSPDWAFNQTAEAAGCTHRIVGRPARRAGGNVMSESATLKIWRGLDANAGRWENYRCRLRPVGSSARRPALDPGQSRPTLAIRFSCINANACKECMIELDGKDGLRLHCPPASRAR